MGRVSERWQRAEVPGTATRRSCAPQEHDACQAPSMRTVSRRLVALIFLADRSSSIALLRALGRRRRRASRSTAGCPQPAQAELLAAHGSGCRCHARRRAPASTCSPCRARRCARDGDQRVERRAEGCRAHARRGRRLRRRPPRVGSDVNATDHWLACLPLSHVGGLSVVTRALHTGTRLTVHDGFDADAVDRSDATLVSLVATALARIDPTRFRAIVLGGSRPPGAAAGEHRRDLRHDRDRQRRRVRPAPARRRRGARRRRRVATALPDAAALLSRRQRPAHARRVVPHRRSRERSTTKDSSASTAARAT